MDEVFKLYQPHGEPRYGDRHLVIVAEPVYPDDELDEEDTYVKGVYCVFVPRFLSDELAARAAMNAFHSQVPICNPGHFEYTITDEESGEELHEPDPDVLELTADEEHGLELLGGTVYMCH